MVPLILNSSLLCEFTVMKDYKDKKDTKKGKHVIRVSTCDKLFFNESLFLARFFFKADFASDPQYFPIRNL